MSTNGCPLCVEMDAIPGEFRTWHHATTLNVHQESPGIYKDPPTISCQLLNMLIGVNDYIMSSRKRGASTSMINSPTWQTTSVKIS